MDENMLNLIQAIEELRKSRGLSQKELIDNIISASSYTRIKNGYAEFPMRILFPLAQKLSARVEDILDLYYTNLNASKLPLIVNYRQITKDHNTEAAILLYKDLLKEYPNMNILRYRLLLEKYFSTETSEIPPLDIRELHTLIEKTLITKHLTSYDLQFIADFTTVFSIDQIRLLTKRLLEINLDSVINNNHYFRMYYPICVGNLADYYMDLKLFAESNLVLNKFEQIAAQIDSMELKIWATYLKKVLIIYETDYQEIKNSLLDELGQEISAWLTHLPTSGMTTGLQQSYIRLLDRNGMPPTNIDSPPIYILKP